jgi:hypothetical protein
MMTDVPPLRAADRYARGMTIAKVELTFAH